jgi:hypothetical protein
MTAVRKDSQLPNRRLTAWILGRPVTFAAFPNSPEVGNRLNTPLRSTTKITSSSSPGPLNHQALVLGSALLDCRRWVLALPSRWIARCPKQLADPFSGDPSRSPMTARLWPARWATKRAATSRLGVRVRLPPSAMSKGLRMGWNSDPTGAPDPGPHRRTALPLG